MIAFTAHGVPVGQGSKSAFIRGGRAVMVETANLGRKTRKPGSLDRWRAMVAWKAKAAAMGRVTDQPVELAARFRFPRPTSHYTGKGELTKSARELKRYPGKPDLSKLVRAIEDALTGIVYGDDAQIATYGKIEKAYCERGESPGVAGLSRPAL